ncbi:hypothetical protein [Streptomyces sp. NPDC088739]|uniref:hypothetical protein n=1 Tax=Streptomyces sp. NPDC088739 TaxID=3365882 RepID=UPI003811836D
MVSLAREAAAAFYGRHRESCDILAYSLIASTFFLALGAVLYVLAAALNGWQGG